MELIGLAVVLFASTNVDDIFVLVSFFADRNFQTKNIVLGQFAGILILYAVSVAGCLLTLLIPRPYIGLLGMFAVGLGVKKLFDLTRNQAEPETIPRPIKGLSSYGKTTSVALVTLANGGDNIGVYTPAFAVHSGRQIAVIGLVFAVLTAVWCLFAHRVVHHPTLGGPIRRYGDRIAPLVLIAIGVLVMHEAGTFALLFHRGH